MFNFRTSKGRTTILIGATAIGLMLVAAILPRRDPSQFEPSHVLSVTAWAAATIGLWIAFMMRIYQSMDEYNRHAEQVSWLWGGVIGLAASLPVFAFVALGGLHWIWPASPTGHDVARAFGLGYMIPTAMQAIGASVVGIWWRWGRK